MGRKTAEGNGRETEEVHEMVSYSLYVNIWIDWEEYHGMNGRDVASSAYVVVCGGGNTMT